jgi:FkbM family methyltransferase
MQSPARNAKYSLAHCAASAAFHWRNVKREKNRMRAATATLLVLCGGQRYIHFNHNGSRFRLRAAGLSRWLWQNPRCLLDGELFFSKFLRSGDTVLDVGANVGVHTLLASRLVGDTGTIIALEPHPATHRALLENTRLNRRENVRALHLAAGTEKGFVRLSDLSADDCNRVEHTGGIVAPQETIDETCRGVGEVHLLKIDVEGYELPALRHASGILRRTQCAVVEYSPESASAFGYDAGQLIGFLSQHLPLGYELHENGATATLTPLSGRYAPTKLVNLVFVRDPGVLERRLGRGAVVSDKK